MEVHGNPSWSLSVGTRCNRMAHCPCAMIPFFWFFSNAAIRNVFYSKMISKAAKSNKPLAAQQKTQFPSDLTQVFHRRSIRTSSQVTERRRTLAGSAATIFISSVYTTEHKNEISPAR